MKEERFREIAGNAETQSLLGIWCQTEYDTSVFGERRDMFIHVLDRLLREGQIKLHKRGAFLDSTIEAQLEAFRQAFPSSEEDADRRITKAGYQLPYDGAGMNVWWFGDSCPADVAWRRSDGTY